LETREKFLIFQNYSGTGLLRAAALNKPVPE